MLCSTHTSLKTLFILPFNLDDVVCNLRNERYTNTTTDLIRGIVRDVYYLLRPSLAVRIRKHLQRAYLSGWQRLPFPAWPIDRSADSIMERALALGLEASGVDSIPFIWFWPNGHNSCAILTHDVETEVGRDFCSTLMDLDDSCGMKSAFQVVPECRYEVPASYLANLRERGFEVNVHDLNHDGMLFANEKTFMRRVRAINKYGREFSARGFRAGIMYRNQDWFHALEFEYDMSVPNVAHLERTTRRLLHYHALFHRRYSGASAYYISGLHNVSHSRRAKYRTLET